MENNDRDFKIDVEIRQPKEKESKETIYTEIF